MNIQEINDAFDREYERYVANLNDTELIKRAKIAWHNNKTDFILLPIYSTDGTQLLDIAFYKEGREWVGRIRNEDMIELVKAAEEHSKKDMPLNQEKK